MVGGYFGGAILLNNSSSNLEDLGTIREVIDNYDEKVFTLANELMQTTYMNLVFKDGKLISASGLPEGLDESEDNPGNGGGSGNVEPGDDPVTTPSVMYDSEEEQLGTDASLHVSSNIPSVYTVNKLETSDSDYQKLINEMNGIVKGKYKMTTLGAFRAEVTENADRIDILKFNLGTKYNGKKVFIGYLNKNSEYKYYEGTVKDGQVSVTIKDGVKVGMIALKEEIMNTTPGGKDDKLPQTGEETNRFTGWLSTAIVLGVVWLGSMLVIERENKKMSKR